MKRHLLNLIFTVVFSISVFSQVANQPGNLSQCGNEVFNLAAQTSIILGNQPQPQHTVGYFLTEANAVANANPILNTTAYVATGQTQTIWARATNTSNGTFATTSFVISWNAIFQTPEWPDVVACDEFTFIPTPGLSFSLDEAGTVAAPFSISFSTDIYIHSTNPCSTVTSFNVTVLPPIPIPQAVNITVCDFYVVPTLPAGITYHFTSGGSPGTSIPAGTMITTSQMVFAYASNGSCSNESNFVVTVNSTPPTPTPADVVVCDTYILPALQPLNSYHTASGGSFGTLLTAGNAITTSQEIFIFAQSGTVPNCTAENSFYVTVVNSLTQIDDVTACASYTLPVLPPGGNYFTGPNGSGIQLAPGEVITLTATIYVLFESGTIPNCSSDQSFTITIGTAPANEPAPLVVCDPDSDGYAVFNLNTKINEIVGNQPGYNVSFYETQNDAQNESNAISTPSAYQNIVPNAQTVYVRLEGSPSCFAFTELQLSTTFCITNTISGMVRTDTDENGCTASDGGAANVQVALINGNNIQYSYTNSAGQYNFFDVAQGVNTLSIQSGLPVGFGAASPVSQTVNVPANSSSDNVDFCITPTTPIYDAGITLCATSIARPGSVASYAMVISNNGNAPISGIGTMNFDASKMTFLNSNPNPSGQVAGTLTFNYSVLPFQLRYIQLNFMIATPPTVDAGQVLLFTANVVNDQSETTIVNNTAAINQIVVNSQDPNDITVLEGPFITPAQADDYLNYVVRFQNMGSAEAVNIRIENELDANLDWSTFRTIAASHIFSAERIDGEAVFRFDNINLPAASLNEAASHGFIAYKVKPKAAFSAGEVITNEANIFFDFNAPILTNQVTTQIQTLAVAQNGFAHLSVYPNPVSDFVAVWCENASSIEISIFDLQGKVVLKDNLLMSNSQGSLNVSTLQSGLYFLKLVSGSKSITKKLVVE